jgi:ATP-dependent DNA helicase DinG
LILDEAHNIEDIATDYFASRVSQLDIMRLLARLTSEKGGKEHGKLVVLKQKLMQTYKNEVNQALSSIYQRLTIDLPGYRHDVLLQTRQTFDVLFNYSQTMNGKNQKGEQDSSHSEQKLRLLPNDYEQHSWTHGALPAIKMLSDSLQRFSQGLVGVVADIRLLKDQTFQETTAGTLFEIEGLSGRVQTLADEMASFIKQAPPFTSVRWIELQALKVMINTAMVDAKLDIADYLAASLFSKISTVVLCSATLTTNGQFSFIRNRLGLTQGHHKDRTIKEHIYQSPFDFQKQMMLAVPNDLPLPSDPAFTKAAAKAICRFVEASHGNAFVLFTSYAMMTECFDMVKDHLLERRYSLTKQGDADRQQLLKRFVSTDRSVLFGTDSFWEGIDIGGEALRCVIIVKLPFKAPNDPIIEARSEAIVHKGGDPFASYSLPQAIVKFKQGFGRLIRQKSDRGCVICLDQRIMTKRYGNQFLQSLPPCKRLFDSQDTIVDSMKEFYKATHYLTKTTNKS